MMARNKPLPRLLVLLGLVLSVSACAPAQTRRLTPQSAEIPLLLTKAQQEATASICSPTCSVRLATELQGLGGLWNVPVSQN